MFGCCSARSERKATGSIPLPVRPSSERASVNGQSVGGEDAASSGRIGVSFVKDEQSGNILIKGLAPGGAAEESGLCIPGDVLLEVDNETVDNIPELYKKIAGPVGSSVTLLLRGSRGSNKKFTLVRRAADSAPSVGASVSSSSSSSSQQLSNRGSSSGNGFNNSSAYVPPSSLNISSSSSYGPPKFPSTTSSSSSPPISNRSSASSLPSSSVKGPEIVGIGVTFFQSPSGSMTVKSLLPGGPAALAGGISNGDVLVEVDGVNVETSSVDRIAQLVLGPRGSSVVVGFRSGDGPLRRVTLRRDWAIPDASSSSNR